MSRFFHGGSESETESEASETELPPRPTVGTRNLRYSDDDEDTKRTVRSEKDKRYEELHNIIKQLKNHKKIRDMSSVLTDFEQLGKAYDKAKNVVDREGIPRFYIKCLADLEDFVNTCWEDRDWRKTINKNNAKGLSTLRQKLRKYNRDFETPISNYRENPDDGDDDKDYDDEGEEKDEESETEAAPATAFLRKPAAEVKGSDDEGDEDDDDDSDWPSESSESSESDIDRGESGYPTAEYFLKKTTEAESSKKEDRKKLKRDKKDKRVQEDEGEWEEVRGGAPMAMEKPKMFAKDQEITHEAVYKKLFEIVSARGKKATDRSEQLELLHELKTVSEAHNLGPAMSSKILFNIIAAIFDYNPNIATCMKNDMWECTMETIGQILELLNANRDIHIGENILEESEILDVSPYRVRGSLLAVVERMDEEYIKMLQACDAHSTEYVERLKDEQKVCELVDRVQIYYEERGSTSDELCRIYLRRIEHLYYKFDETRFTVKGKTVSEQMMDKLCKYLYSKDNTDRLRTRAMLCNIFHLAVHDRWYEARDLMLMSHLQDIIQHSDVPTQLLYNRTLVQLGLCAFRQGMTKDAHNALVDIQSSNRSKELLAQGLLPQRQHERTPEQEKIDKRRLLPYHMHINLELLECVYLVSAMLMEIPYMAAHELDVRRRMISKNFHHVMKMSERQTLTGPPESMREHVVAASKAMKIGDWKACKNFIINEKMNTKVWDLFPRADVVRDMITGKIQEESLRTYLFTYSSIYDSFCLDNLAEMFQLEKPVAHSIISKMILNEELMASLDEPTQSVIMHQTEPSRLQSLALQLSEKVSTLVENNERVMEIKQGNFFFSKSNTQNYQNQQQGWGQGRWGDGGRRGQNKDRRQNRRGYDRGDRGDRDRGQYRRNYDD